MIVICPTCKTELATQAPGRLTRDLQAVAISQQLVTRLTEALEAVYPYLDCNCYGKHNDNCVRGKADAALAAVAKERAL